MNKGYKIKEPFFLCEDDISDADTEIVELYSIEARLEPSPLYDNDERIAAEVKRRKCRQVLQKSDIYVVSNLLANLWCEAALNGEKQDD